MADENDKIETKDENILVEPAEKKADPKPIVAGDEGIDELKRQLEAEREARRKSDDARIAAERRALEASRSAQGAKAEVDDTNMRMVETAIETVKGNLDQLEAAYANAIAGGDTAAAAKLQRQMTEFTVKLGALEEGKAAMAAKPKVAPPVINDPVEALASQLTARSADWIRRHPEYATNQERYAAMVAAHNLAVAKRIAPDSDEYFAYVEGQLADTFGDLRGVSASRARVEPEDGDEDALSSAARPVASRSSPAAAPVSRGSNSPTGGSRIVKLTPDEVEAARLSKQTPEEYYANKMSLKREGRVH